MQSKSECRLFVGVRWFTAAVIFVIALRSAADAPAQTIPNTPPTKTAIPSSSPPADWFSAGNWNPSGVPASTDDVGIGLGTRVQISPFTTPAAARTVTLGVLTGGVYSSGELDVLGGTLNITPLVGTVNPGLQILSGSTLQIANGGTVNLGAFTVDNFGQITTGSFSSGGTLTTGTIINELGGAIQGIGTAALSFTTPAGGTVVNAGQITSSEASTSVPPAIIVTDGPANITNSGTISGVFRGVVLEDGGLVTNKAGGSIIGSSGEGILSTVPAALTGPLAAATAAPAVTIVNFGNISGTFAAIEADAGGSVTNNAGGIIQGANGDGIASSASEAGVPPPLTVANSGTISGSVNAIDLGGGGSVNNNAEGLIMIISGSGNKGAAIISNGGPLIFSNAGVVNGNVTAGSFANTATLFVGGRIVGNLDLGNPTLASLILDGAGTQLLSQAVTGNITNFNSLIKQGTGTWTIDEALTYSGGTNLNGGTLAVSSDTNLGTGPLSFNGGTLEALAAAGGLVSSKAITLNSAGGTFLADGGSASTLSGAITGIGSWTKTGLGTLTLSGANTYSGGTNLNGGVLAVNSDANLGTGALSFNGGALEALATGGGIVSSKAITLNSAGGTFLADSGTGSTLSGAITGTGSWTKTGPGILTLSGSNSYSGTTTVHAGVLQAGSLDALSANSAFTINAGAVLDLNGFSNVIGSLAGSGRVTNARGVGGPPATLSVGADNTSTTFSGALEDGSRTLGLTKVGTGTLILAGTNTYTGATTVNAGSLIVDGSIASAQTLVSAGGLLGGHGSLGGSLVNNGIVSPGDSPGTLTVNNNYTQNAGGTLRIEVASVTQHDLLAVSGHASLAGTLQFISLGDFKLHVGDQLKFLTANGGINGTFDTVQNPFVTGTIVKSEVVYLPNAVVLEGTQGSFVPVACTPNAVAVAHALDSAVGNSGSAELINFLDEQPINQLCNDLQLIAPELLASIFNIGVSLANVQTANLNRRMDDIRAGSNGFSAAGFTLNGSAPSSSGGFAGVSGPEGKSGPSVMAPIPENRWGVWITGIGEFTNVDSTNEADGYDLQTGGVTFGVDYRVCPNFAIGLTAGYAHTNADLANGGNLDVNGGTLGLYATLFGNGFYLDTAVTGGPSGYDTHRTALLGSANGSTVGGDLNVLVAAGYDWKKGGLTIGPTASFQYTYVGFGGFTESGSLAPLDIHSQNAESERTAFGMKASYDWKVGHVIIVPQINLAWQHEYGDQAYSIVSSFANGAGNSFTVNSPKVGRDSLLIGAGAAVLLSERVSVYAYYDGEVFRTNYQSNNVSAGVRVTF